ncbi:MAG: N-acetyltransferase family protein [Gemmatimonadota bacterium]
MSAVPDSSGVPAVGPGGGDVEVRPARSGDAMRAFVRLPWSLYRGDPNWVPPLLSDVRKAFDPDRHPFHRHSDVQPFLAVRGGRPVGRICAVHNRRHVDFHEEPVGFFGYFESRRDPAVASALFEAAGRWLADRGLETMRGPANFSSNEEWGMLVEGFDSPPSILMPYNPPFYPELLEEYGFEEAKTLVAYWLDDPDPPDRLVRASRIVKDRYGVEVRPVRMDDFEEEVERIRRLYNVAWERNWGFVPMTDAEFDFMAEELKPVVEPELIKMAEGPDGELIGFTVAVPDFNRAIRHANGRLFPFGLLRILWHARKIGRMRVLTLGIHPEWRRRGVDALLYLELFRGGRGLGITEGEFSWMLEDNEEIRRPMERMGAEVYKRYRLYDVSL